MVLTTVVLRQSHCTQHLSRFISYLPYTCPKPCFILPCRCSRSIKHSPLSAPCSPSLLPLETSMASTRWTSKFKFCHMLSQSGWQRGAVPQVVERAPRLCEGAVEVLRGEAPLPSHARWQRVFCCRDRGSGRQTTEWNGHLHMTFIR